MDFLKLFDWLFPMPVYALAFAGEGEGGSPAGGQEGSEGAAGSEGGESAEGSEGSEGGEAGGEKPPEDTTDYKVKFEEAQKVISETKDLVKRQDELLHGAFDAIKNLEGGGKTGRADKAGAGEGDFIKGIVESIPFEKVIDDPDSVKAAFENAMRKVYDRAKGDSQREIIEMYNAGQNQARTQKQIFDKFYDTNKDLADAKKIVGYCVKDVADEHPNWSLDKVLEETANMARKMKKGIDVNDKDKPPVNLEKGGGGKPPANKPTGAETAKGALTDYMAERAEFVKGKV